MLYIDDQLPHVQLAKNAHSQFMTCYVLRKIYGNSYAFSCGDRTCKICVSKIRKVKVSKYLLSVLKQLDIKKIIESQPSDLIKSSDQFKKLYHKSRKAISKTDQESIGKIFNYEWFIDNEIYNAYDLCRNLKIETCVYCNRLYTSTVISKKNGNIIRPTLDHWFAKSQRPILAISFYNLIPSCSPCNSSVKHAVVFDLKANIHPYVDKNITGDYQLLSTYDKSLKSFKIVVDTKNKKIKSTLKAMEIAAIYEHHQSELADLDILKKKYNKTYLNNLAKLLGTSLKEKDVYRIIFGVEYDDENFYKRPLSKLKKDILKFKLK